MVKEAATTAVMTTILPTWPHVVFAVIEPISLIAGSFYSFFFLEDFVVGQTPYDTTPVPLPASTHAVGLQLGNVYLLLMLLGVGIMYATNEPKVLRNYLIALGIADLSHIYCVYLGLGREHVFHAGSWNALTWGNLGVTAFLFLNRIGYLFGLFGKPSFPSQQSRKVKIK